MMFSELTISVVCYLILIWENCQSLLFQIFLWFLFLFLIFPVFSLSIFHTFCFCLTVFGYSVDVVIVDKVFLSLLLLLLFFFRILLIHPLTQSSSFSHVWFTMVYYVYQRYFYIFITDC